MARNAQVINAMGMIPEGVQVWGRETVDARGKRAPLIINFDPRRAADADLAHLPRDERSV